MELAKFLVLTSPNLSNIGTVRERTAGFANPDYYEISNEELEVFKAMSDAHKKAFIQEKLSAKHSQILTATPEKKNVEVAEVEIKLDDEITEESIIEEEIIETVSEVKTIELLETENAEESEEAPKAKGRPKKEK
jgi:hypothetical protein